MFCALGGLKSAVKKYRISLTLGMGFCIILNKIDRMTEYRIQNTGGKRGNQEIGRTGEEILNIQYPRKYFSGVLGDLRG